jgi:hypothetical protein
MATKSSIAHLRRGATALTAEAGKLIRDRALSAAHQALVLALQSVQAADRKLRGTGTTRRGRAIAIKRKSARPTAKARRTAAASTPRRKSARRARRIAR